MAIDAVKTIRLWDSLTAEKTNFTTFFQEVTDYVLPTASNTRRHQTPGRRRGVERYDPTAVESAERLAASLGTTLANASTEWFQVGFEDQELTETDSVSDWLDDSLGIMLNELARSNFYSQIDEALLDVIGYGTTALACMPRSFNFTEGITGLIYDAWPIREYVFTEAFDGSVDEVYRTRKMNPLQVLAQFGDLPGFKGLGKTMEAAMESAQQRTGSVQKAYQDYDIIHAIYPRRDRDPIRRDSKNFPFGSAYIAKDDKHVIWESGFLEKPFGLARWRKNADDRGWGRGPGLTAMPTIRTLNDFARIMLTSGEKDANPPLVVESKGVIGSIRTSPNGITYKKHNAKLEYLTSGSNFNFAAAELSELKNQVRQMFFTDQLQALTGEPTPNMTAFEFGRRLDLARQALGSTFGRLQSELFDPIITRTFSLLLRGGRFPPVPAELQGLTDVELKIDYIGPLARAQKAGDITAIQQAYEFGGFIAQTTGKTEALDVLNDQEAERTAAELLGVPASVINDEKTVEAIQAQRQEAAQAEQALVEAQQVADVAATAGAV